MFYSGRIRNMARGSAELIFKSRHVKGKYNLVSDALLRMYDSTATKLYYGDDGMKSSKTAAENASVQFLSVNVLNVGDIQMGKSVIEEL
jgi:hypothetical protein